MSGECHMKERIEKKKKFFQVVHRCMATGLAADEKMANPR